MPWSLWSLGCSWANHVLVQYDQPYVEPPPQPPDQYMEEAGPSNAEPSPEQPLPEAADRTQRGRKRNKTQVRLDRPSATALLTL